VIDVSDSMLTTTDNPYDPFTQFSEWMTYDMQMGYNTVNYLARMVVSSPDLSYEDQELSIEQAIDQIVNDNVSGLYTKVTRADDGAASSNANEDSTSIV